MNGLPDGLALRFHLYLNILPVLEQIAMYACFVAGVVCLPLAVYRCAVRRREKGNKQVRFMDEEMAYIDRKLSYIPEKRGSMSSKEFEVYVSSLVTPLNQEISFQEFQDMKEDDV